MMAFKWQKQPKHRVYGIIQRKISITYHFRHSGQFLGLALSPGANCTLSAMLDAVYESLLWRKRKKVASERGDRSHATRTTLQASRYHLPDRVTLGGRQLSHTTMQS